MAKPTAIVPEYSQAPPLVCFDPSCVAGDASQVSLTAEPGCAHANPGVGVSLASDSSSRERTLLVHHDECVLS
jgi:hypothetical protein